MDREAYLVNLARYASALRAVHSGGDADRKAYVHRLVALARGLDAGAATREAEYEQAFRTVLEPRAREILWRVAGATVERCRLLTDDNRQRLRVLEIWPDLLGPLGFERTELAHSSALAFFLDPTRARAVGADCQASFFNMALRVGLAGQRPDLPENLDFEGARVRTERVVRGGRVDISIDGRHAVAFIEVKVDAAEGPQQLRRYGSALSQLAAGRPSILIFLTVKQDQTGDQTEGHVHLTFRDLLRAWLPIAASSATRETRYLRMYLKTIAALERLAGDGDFERWDVGVQRAALAFIEQELDA